MKALSYVLAALVLTHAAACGTGKSSKTAKATTTEKEELSVDERYTLMAELTNKNLPNEMENSVIYESAHYANRTLTHTYTLQHIDLRVHDRAKMQAQLLHRFETVDMCSVEDTAEPLRDGVTLAFVYNDVRGEHIHSLARAPKDCEAIWANPAGPAQPAADKPATGIKL